MKLLSSLLLFLFFGTFISAEVTIPKDFSIKYNVVQYKNTFFLENLKDELFAKAYKNGLEDDFSFHLEDLNGEKLSSALGKSDAKKTIVDVYDASKTLIGHIVRKKNSPLPLSYEIYNPQKVLIAEGSMNWLGTRCVLTPPGNAHQEYFMIYRPHFRLPGDYWYIQSKQHDISPMIMVYCAIVETYIEKKNWFISTPL